MRITPFITLPFLLASLSVSADTVIELHSDDAQVQLLSNGKKARINTRGKEEYMLVDYARNNIYTVMPDKKQYINVSEPIPSMSSKQPPAIHLNITPAGNGPVIAGYPTSAYKLSANGTKCGTLYSSKEALKGTSVEDLFGAMKKMADNHRKSLGGFAAAIPPCQLARMELGSKVRKIGAPMKTINTEGHVQSEIIKINKNATVKPSYYDIPANYEKVSMTDTIQKAQRSNQQMDRMQQQMPQMRQMMQQMQESGQLPPEAMEQMQRYQQMMQNQQR